MKQKVGQMIEIMNQQKQQPSQQAQEQPQPNQVDAFNNPLPPQQPPQPAPEQ
jgi:hypothetical protein